MMQVNHLQPTATNDGAFLDSRQLDDISFDMLKAGETLEDLAIVMGLIVHGQISDTAIQAIARLVQYPLELYAGELKTHSNKISELIKE